MIADNIVADVIYCLSFAEISPMVLLLVYSFFLMSILKPMNIPEVLLLFVGCIVNLSVSYLICMFQDFSSCRII